VDEGGAPAVRGLPADVQCRPPAHHGIDTARLLPLLPLHVPAWSLVAPLGADDDTERMARTPRVTGSRLRPGAWTPDATPWAAFASPPAGCTAVSWAPHLPAGALLSLPQGKAPAPAPRCARGCGFDAKMCEDALECPPPFFRPQGQRPCPASKHAGIPGPDEHPKPLPPSSHRRIVTAGVDHLVKIWRSALPLLWVRGRGGGQRGGWGGGATCPRPGTASGHHDP